MARMEIYLEMRFVCIVVNVRIGYDYGVDDILGVVDAADGVVGIRNLCLSIL